MSFLNPNRFGVSLVEGHDVSEMAQVIEDGQLFRLREDGEQSQNDVLEAELAHHINVRHVITVANGTAGLRAALTALGVTRGDFVAVSAYTFVATAHAVLSLGAWPVPVDMNEDLSLDCEDLSRKLAHVKAVIAVYVPGHSSNVAEIVALASKAGIPVLEDACQAFGVRSNGRHAGAIGVLGVYSFQQNKQLASGEGGAVVGSVDVVMDRVRRFADHGAVRQSDGTPTWDHEDALIGDNLRMTELQAAILRPQLREVEWMIHRQRKARNEISQVVSNWPISIARSVDPEGDTGAYIAFLASDPGSVSEWINAAAQHHVLLKRFWPCLFYQHGTVQRAYQGVDLPFEPVCRRAEDLSHRMLSLPIPPTLCDERLDAFLLALSDVQSLLQQHSAYGW